MFWLGDLNGIDDHTLGIMKPHNVDSDHQLIVSEFYAGQMCCIWSEPNKEIRLCDQRDTLYSTILSQYGFSLFHLEGEIQQQKHGYVKPVVFSERSIEPTINMLHKVLVEGVNIPEFQKLYLKLTSSPDAEYEKWKSIKLYEALLRNIISKDDDVREIIAPLYLLNDYRQYYDHLLSASKKDEIKNNILASLCIESFDDTSAIYHELLKRLALLFEYLILGYSNN